MAESAEPALPVNLCPNCGAAGAGPFCAECGQRRPAADDYSPRRFWRHVFHETTEVDSSLVRSVLGLFRPGFLTREHLDGRRARYLSPVKIYLIVSALYFLLGWDATFEMMNYADQLRNDPNMTAAMPTEMGQKYMASLDRIIERSGDYTAYLRFTTVLGLGFVLALLFRRQRRALGQHFVFTLHYYSFYMVFSLLVLAALLLWQAAAGGGVAASLYFAVGYLPMAPFAYLALRRVYGEGRGRTAFKTLLLMLFDCAMWMTVGALAFGAATIQALRS